MRVAKAYPTTQQWCNEGSLTPKELLGISGSTSPLQMQTQVPSFCLSGCSGTGSSLSHHLFFLHFFLHTEFYTAGSSQQPIHIKHSVLGDVLSLNFTTFPGKQVSILWKGASGCYRKEWWLKEDYTSVQPFWQSKQPRKILMEISLIFAEHFYYTIRTFNVTLFSICSSADVPKH